jgi:hypothetical protein
LITIVPSAWARESVIVLRAELDAWFVSRSLDAVAMILLAQLNAGTSGRAGRADTAGHGGLGAAFASGQATRWIAFDRNVYRVARRIGASLTREAAASLRA